MKVAIVSTYGAGGAGIAALRLHRSLLKAGIESTYVTLHKLQANEAHHEVYEHRPSIWQKVGFYLKKGLMAKNELLKAALDKRFDWISFPESALRLENMAAIKEADVVHLHWVADFLNYDTFFASLKAKPIVWTLHDMAPMVGVCHYSVGCDGFEKACEMCPQISDLEARKDTATRALAVKTQSMQKGNIQAIVTPSHWLGGLSKRSKLLARYRHEVIANGMDNKVFCYQDRDEARLSLRIEPERDVVCFVADDLANERKGFGRLLEALKILGQSRQSITLISIGVQDDSGTVVTGIEVRKVGKVTDPNEMARYYAASDLFVTASLFDNLPNTIVEALGVGCPVVAFRATGIAEMLRPSIDGIYAKDVTEAGLAAAIEMGLARKATFDRKEISKCALEKYNPEKQASKYIKVYEDALKATF